jgi:radical SAM protein with 4Fe4S-binding SPASM domain
MSYKFTEDSKVILNKDKVVLGNSHTGIWIRISKEVYDIFVLGIENRFELDDLQSLLLDNDDKKYIYNMYNKLLNLGIIESENKKKVYRNKMVSLEITNKCNLKCIHCCVDSKLNNEEDDLSTDDIKSILDKLVEWNPERIILSGGEPMIRPDFNDIILYLNKKYEGKIVISTNGTLINKNNVKILAENVHQVDVSIDGIDEETCSKIRGKGVFSKVIENIKLLQSHGMNKISLSMTIGAKNAHLEEKFKELNSQLGTYPLIRGFSAIGRGKDSEDTFSYKGETYIPKDISKERFGICPCSAAKREVFIRYNGDVYPCPSFMEDEYLIGNIFDIEKLSILNKKNNFKKVYDIESLLQLADLRKCIDCKVNLFCWSCPGDIRELKGNKLALEDKCLKLKPILYEYVWGEK